MTTENEAIRGKAPAIQWYVNDWMNDPALKMCSLYARGLWAEMLMTMWQCEPQGHLVFNGKPYTLNQLARVVREPEKPVKAALAELEAAGVYTVTNGVIVSRRMVRDVHNRKVRAEGGKKGGNPNLVGGGKVGGKVNHPDEGKDNPKPTPSSSSSASTGEGKPSPAGGGAAGGEAENLPMWLANEMRRYPASWGAAFRPVWQAWLEYLCRTLRKSPDFDMIDGHRKILSECSNDAGREAMVVNAKNRGFREPCAPKKTEGIPQKPLTTKEDHEKRWR